MKVRASSLDDLLNEVFRRLISSGQEIYPRKGKAYERTGVVLELTNPRSRLSRTEERGVIFGWIGELLWYLAGSDEYAFINYYIRNYKPDREGAKTVVAAYGPRLRGEKDQLGWVVDLLRSANDSRRAVIPVYQPDDTDSSLPEVPCTCTLQFLLRDRKLQLITHMRSNDAFVGLPGDVFAFTMIQELVARSLNVELGPYKHLVGSLHLYEVDKARASRFIEEGFQEKIVMPIMPIGDQFPYLTQLLDFERGTRLGERPNLPADLPPYWQDVARLLGIWRAYKHKASPSLVSSLCAQMQSDAFQPMLELRQQRAERQEAVPSTSTDRLFD